MSDILPKAVAAFFDSTHGKTGALRLDCFSNSFPDGFSMQEDGLFRPAAPDCGPWCSCIYLLLVQRPCTVHGLKVCRSCTGRCPHEDE